MKARDVVACPMCEGRSFRVVPLEYEFAGIRWPAAECLTCQMMFLSRQPTQEGLIELYSPEYFQSDYHCGCDECSYFTNEASQVAAAEAQLQWLEEKIRPGRILEIGCAGGYFLRTAKARGWEAVGVELSDYAAQFARETLGLDVRTGTLETVDLPPASFDAIFMGDVLEHLTDPMPSLRSARRLLRPGGLILIDGPSSLNSVSWRIRLPLYRLLGRKRLLQSAPYHVLEFTPATLRGSVVRAGFLPLWTREGKLSPRGTVRLGSPVARLVKSTIEGANWLLTSAFGRLGDRVSLLAMRPPGN